MSKIKKITHQQLLFFTRAFFFALFFLLLGGIVGFQLAKKDLVTPISFPSQEKTDMSLFWYTWNLLEEKYLKKTSLDPQKMIYGAISGMVSSLEDPYTIFLPPEENKITKEDLNGEFGGVGIQLGYKEKMLAVISPLENTPAQKAGIKAGDIILKIQDESKKLDISTEKISLPEAIQAIRGPEGTKIQLTILREGIEKPFSVEIVRAKITLPTVVWRQIDYQGRKIAYVQVLRFAQIMEKQWFDWLKTVAVLKKDPQFAGVILDLRNNPGGYLNGAVFLASEFLKEGVVVEQEYSSGKKDYYRVTRKGSLLDVPLVVLINQGSASASEILAGALQYYQRAILIGEKTFGKGTVQEPQELPRGAGLHITISRWLLPGEGDIDQKGVFPDIEVKSTDIENNQDDLVLEKAKEEIIKLKGIE